MKAVVPFSAAPDLPAGPLTNCAADASSRWPIVRALFDDIAPSYDRVERIFALGSGSWYRKQALRRAGLGPGMRVLDVATGTGLVAREALAISGEAGCVVGMDLSAGMLSAMRTDFTIPLVQAGGEKMPFRDGAFDFVSIGFALRHVADLGTLFAEARRVLKPGGKLCVLEFTRPRSAVRATPLRVFMTKIVPAFAGGAARRSEARRLMRVTWDTIEACAPPETVLGALAGAGFRESRRETSVGIFSEYVCRNA